jgi:hypothetical protein
MVKLSPPASCKVPGISPTLGGVERHFITKGYKPLYELSQMAPQLSVAGHWIIDKQQLFHLDKSPLRSFFRRIIL